MNNKQNANEQNANETVSNSGNNDLLREISEINDQLDLINQEEEQLEKYLHSNIFNFVEAKEGLEDIFAIQNNALKIVDELDRDSLQLDRTIPLLEVRHVTKYYENNKVPSLTNTSLKVYPGDFHVLVGANGSGKTTLLNCLLQKLPYEGEILMANKFATSESENVWLPLVGVLPSKNDFNGETVVQDLMVEKLKELNKSEVEARAYTRSAMEELSIWHLRTRRYVQLTLLERRKLGIALLLAKDPHLVILDEPLVGLQQHEQVELLILLAKLQRQNRGILVLSHLINEFSGYANVMTILSKGRVFYSGLIEHLELHNRFKFLVKTTNNQLALESLRNVNCKFRFNEVARNILVKFDNQLSLLVFQKECANKNIAITDLRQAATSLEDLYEVLLKVGTANAVREIYQYREEFKNKQVWDN